MKVFFIRHAFKKTSSCACTNFCFKCKRLLLFMDDVIYNLSLFLQTQTTATRHNSRIVNQSRRISSRVSSIESTRITTFSGTAKQRVSMSKSKPIRTISNDIKTSEAILTTESSVVSTAHSTENSV